MTDPLLRTLLGATLGLALVLLLRRPGRRAFGAGPAFALWLLPPVLALAPLLPLPGKFAPAMAALLPTLTVVPRQALSSGSDGVHVAWTTVLIGAWLVGTAIGIARLLRQYARLRHSVRRAPAAWSSLLPPAAPWLDLRDVRVHPAGPAVLCALPRPLVLLPRDFEARFADADARALVLRHELAHVRRGDPWWTLAMELASALLWFHPLAWIARPRFRLDQELACDAAALRPTPQQAARYARALVESVSAQPAPALIPWLAEPQLKERIAMLAHRVPGVVRRRAGYLVAALLLGGSAYLLGGQAPLAAAAAAPALPGTVSGHVASASTAASVDVSYKNRNPPRYPIDAVHNGEEGTVVLKVTVDATGKVTRLAIDPQGTTAPHQLQVAALTAAGGWKFIPGHADGRAVGGVVTVPVKFSLQGEDGKSYVPPCGLDSQYVSQIKQCVKLVQPTAAR